MANTLLTATMITNQALMILVNELTMAGNINRQYDGAFGQDGAKIGSVLNIRKPPKYIASDGPGIQLQDISDSTVPLAVNQQKHVDTALTTADLRLSLVDLTDQYIKPATATLAQQVDSAVTLLYKKVANYNGVVGTTPATALLFLQAGAQLDNEAVPRDSRNVVMSPNTNAVIADALKGFFNPQSLIGDIVRKGLLSKNTLGWDFYMDQSMQTHVIGALGTAGAVTSNPIYSGGVADVKDANGVVIASSIPMTGWDASINGILLAGDVIEVAAVNQVNPQTRQSTGTLRHFVVQQDVNSDNTGAATAIVAPPIVPAGAFQTVDAAPVANAVITVFGVGTGNFTALQTKATSVQNLAFHKNAFTLAFADLPIPNGVDMAGRSNDDQIRMSIRFVRDYFIGNDTLISRLDVLFGTAALRQEMATRLVT